MAETSFKIAVQTCIFDKISPEFRGILRVFGDFADLLEFRGSATARNMKISKKEYGTAGHLVL